jgi:hypothetical protein
MIGAPICRARIQRPSQASAAAQTSLNWILDASKLKSIGQPLLLPLWWPAPECLFTGAFNMAKSDDVLTGYTSTLSAADSIIGALTGTTAAEYDSVTAASRAQKAASRAQKAAEEEATKRAMIFYATVGAGLLASAFVGVIYFTRR